jgi:reductive dehalogenase
MKLFSYRNRPVHLGPYPLEKLGRADTKPDLARLPSLQPFNMIPDDDSQSIARAMDDYMSLMDSLRDGHVQPKPAAIPGSHSERSQHLKAAGYFLDSAVVGTCELTPDMYLQQNFLHPNIDQWLKKGESNKVHLRLNLAMIYQNMEAAIKASKQPLDQFKHALVYLVEYPRDPRPDEPGTQWIAGMQQQRAALRAAETATVMALYLRTLGFKARAHTATSSDIDINKVALAAGVVELDSEGNLSHPYIGRNFGLSVVTTSLELEPDLPLAPQSLADRIRSKGPAWWVGYGSRKSAWDHKPFARRQFKDSLYPMEKVKRVDETTSYIDAERIPRVPKRTEFFVRIALGDLGEVPQQASVDGFSVMKNPMGKTLASSLNSYAILQRAEENKERATGYDDPITNADTIKATLHFLGADMIGISEAPDWVWYSHSPDGKPLKPAHKYAITTLVDQGHETMEGASGDDWISAAQSMRSYMRASLVGGVVAQHLRNLGFPATNHTAADGDVLQPPLMLLSGLGEISRIGDLILNPHLGPRLKCGVVTTDFPMQVDKPIDFGLQEFCSNCSKCARECPSGAITAGEKRMFNGYEIWKPDAEKCARYRMTNDSGSMCGRCMKTCPWNLEGIFKEAPYRWLATRFPTTAPWITKIDDWLGNGGINPVKKWWWDLRTDKTGATLIATDTNQRDLNTDIEVKAEEQTLACYPADLAPPPYPVPSPIDREAGILAYDAMLTPKAHKERVMKGETEDLVPQYRVPKGQPPVMMVKLQTRTETSTDGKVVKFEFVSMDGSPLPPFEAGAHIDVMPVPQFIRQYSLCGDPADPSRYVIGVLREDDGRGGSKRIHGMLREGKPVLISRPRNHFPLIAGAKRSLLMAGGIGVTPMIAMAHELHAQDKEFIFYYKASTRAGAGFVDELQQVPWAHKVHFFFSDENRLNVADVLGDYQPGDHLYTCGPAAFMDAVFDSALAQGWEEDNLHREYFSAPTGEEYENHAFKLILKQSGIEIDVPKDKKATEALADAGYAVDTKCSDGICGVCATDYVDGDIEHRDFVLSKAQRQQKMVLCCSRAAEPQGEIVLNI